MRFVYFYLIFSFSIRAQAFPEMIRTGYASCIACHSSPAGGGVLTPYGRVLSSEMLSTWGGEKEAQIFHGALSQEATESLQEWFLLGGIYRGLQVHQENDLIKQGRWIDMQAQLETALMFGSWTVDLAFGHYDSEGHWQGSGHQYYIMNQVNESITIRAGQFLPQFGLNIPEHISPTRAVLGFGASDQRQAIEIQSNEDPWTLTGTIHQTSSASRFAGEKGIAIKVERVFAETLKPGVSYWRSDQEESTLQLIGVHGMFGFQKKFFWLMEWDWEELLQKQGSRVSHRAVTAHKLGWEIHKGLIGFLASNLWLQSLEDPHSQVLHYGAGVQFFPRPHFQVEGLWTREQVPSIFPGEGDYAWLLIHYYI